MASTDVDNTMVVVGRWMMMTERCRVCLLGLYTVFQKNWHPFCFCYNFVSCDQILVFFGSLVAKEICNRPLLTYVKVIAGALR